jgi:hypothetical protein
MMAAMERGGPPAPARRTRAGARGRRATLTLLVLALAGSAVAGCSDDGDGVAAPTPTSAITQPTPSSSTGEGPSAVSSRFGPPVLLGQIVDEGVTESSGLVASRRNPGRLWTHNDSENPPVLHCVERDVRSCGGWTVDGARNVDWEDIAAGPGPQPGEHYLYVGDIGDNTAERDEVVVYRVVEPAVAADPGPGAGGTTDSATAIRLRYEDGPHDAESLAVHPTTADIYVVTKTTGAAVVYKAPAGGGVLTRIAGIGLGLLGLANGADISPDGRRVALCTPVGGYELSLDGTEDIPAGAGFDAVWAAPPVAVTLPGRRQGEAIAYRLDGGALLVTSEGHPSPLHEVPRL